MHKRFFDKGNVSSLISLALLLGGLAGSHYVLPGSNWILAAGLFGFAGGMTNWLAVKMLFDRVPLLYGSGVIPARFREIRTTLRDLIMHHFFAEDYLTRFLASRTQGDGAGPDMAERLSALLQSREVDAAIDRKLAELTQSPMGMMLKMVGPETIKPLVHQFVGEVGAAVAPRLAEELRAQTLDPAGMRQQVDALLAAKLEELTPDTVKQMMEDVIREHLGWLIVWGNVFGGAIGVVSMALGYGPG
jgi:uncharacterized membrane protein YheB (UPF0754 family)